MYCVNSCKMMLTTQGHTQTRPTLKRCTLKIIQCVLNTENILVDELAS